MNRVHSRPRKAAHPPTTEQKHPELRRAATRAQVRVERRLSGTGPPHLFAALSATPRHDQARRGRSSRELAQPTSVTKSRGADVCEPENKPEKHRESAACGRE